MGQALAIGTVSAAMASEAVAKVVLSWPGVTADGGPLEASTEFRFRRQVLGHLYSACGDHAAVDAIFPETMGEAFIALGRGDRHPVVPDAGWVLKPIRSEADITAAIGLLRDNYDRLSHRLRLVWSSPSGVF
jgi:hypothetical protein